MPSSNGGESSDENNDSDHSTPLSNPWNFVFDFQSNLKKIASLPEDQAKADIDLIQDLITKKKIQDDQEYEPFKNVPNPNVGTVKSSRSRGRSRRKKPLLFWEVWEHEQKKLIDEHLAEEVDLENQGVFMAETADPPSNCVIPLLRYQKEWLAWALKQEESSTRGGILADEMGMGKTVQAIALVFAKRGSYHKTHVDDTPSLASTSSTDLPWVKATLVVCPKIAVTQWVNEIDRFTTKGSMKVLVRHHDYRENSSEQFSTFDFVITTYSTLEAEYRKSMMPPKDKCPYCGSLFLPGKLKVHQIYFCGPTKRTEKLSKQQRKKMKTIPSTSKTKMQSDEYNELEDGDFDENFELLKPKLNSFHSVNWNRIILDEAHYIKNRNCKTAKAIFALESSYKWALSGTPIQNRVTELYSLVRFLQVVPYSFYLCRDCDCRILEYRPSRPCSNCPHCTSRHFCWWNKYISKPIVRGYSFDRRRAMTLLKQKVLKEIALRRTKNGRAADLALPPRIVTIRRDALDDKEQDYYESLRKHSQTQFNTYVTAGTVMNNYAHIFELLTRLRQAVDHPYLVEYSKTAASGNEKKLHPAQDEQVCGICHVPAEDPVVTSCTHAFCMACLLDYSASLGQVSCPTCSELLTVDLNSNSNAGEQTLKGSIKGFKSSSILNKIQLNDFQTSTKIEALREEIRFMVERDGSAKGIVFSQFTSFLDLINYSLDKSGVNCVQLAGSMTMARRDAAIKKFTEDPDSRIFLLSLKAGGVALNLTVASHVFMMDPWWNPAVEQQAQDRIHRIGQYKPIRIVKFITENTIEEKIMQLQETKQFAFEVIVDGSTDTEALGDLTISDLHFLFTM